MIRKIYELLLEREVKKKRLPNHIAIIMDGNRRYARKRGLPPQMGHFFGSKKAEKVLEWCYELGIKTLTVFAFSTENFKRNEEEKRNLFQLIRRELFRLAEDKRIHRNRVKVRIIGKKELLPKYVLEAASFVEKRTKEYDNFRLNIAIAYGARQEIAEAVRKVLEKVLNGEVKAEEIDLKMIEENLYENMPVDIIIRTGKEMRLSNFLIWQSASKYAYFCDVYWPEFRRIDLLRAIRSWQKRVERWLDGRQA
ncbi:undecaprenyl diphosphate synthase [Ferroglobus placidus DSM 10642]|uniref:Tritrans,polycis-undecaprenyl-diphosphate synthase (geranylgeranyl-diphosphate specific) n=1 Tax=Ferroglobus placidus (strain DSM 10642 / AEDII12DO) TaxID=589924 RepID=D3S059_FERPA|nr:polyprenyl diphosphate synthase [Ferroglobus placidus]ADC66122.1 undecaprenyl diphosphate synthase [Ferroglobus placidus DSM 10642]